MIITKKNGLNLIQITTKAETAKVTVSDWNSLKNIIEKYIAEAGYLIAYLNYKVLIGQLSKNGPEFYEGETFDLKYLLKLRAFTADKEVLIWKQSSGFFGLRYRIDWENGCDYAVEAEQILWGRPEPSASSWVRLTDQGRGTDLVMPRLANEFKETESRIKLKTRNYIDYSGAGQAGYADCRLVDFLVVREGN